MKSKNGWVLLIMLLSGIVLGGFIGMLTARVSGLSWLNYGQSFGAGESRCSGSGAVGVDFWPDNSDFYCQHYRCCACDYYLPKAIKNVDRFGNLTAWRAERKTNEGNDERII